ncbi:FlgN protein [Rosistilla carotiformis]|uniref:FlgN protein n=1 Tax=Rosistilla carotiformis TaxID=2528017 RepID=A0A518JNB2_9BACT|nr:flagellar export chaperone FlgN [Rosistilla carotiformis]QDV67040.1 FlgN protein [Rosistilla carotiformis]
MTLHPHADAASRLSQLVDEKFHLLVALLEKGEQQRQMIETGDATALLHLLAEKQTLISDLQRLQDAISTIQLAGELVWPSPELRGRCQAAAQQCNALGQQVLEMEAVCERQATTQRDAMAKQIQEFSNFNSRSSNSYSLDDETHLAEFDESS